ncbi:MULTISPECIES: ClpX C4-type zinc finger protein [unclassified Paraburkholderia]|uniref:ClpX C4-type zinc finger protein n=1 Tax=unclassified Paraburkholderia TaxID=2615204 RepID=UPI000E27D992|nr:MULTISPECIES: ClpX C4-type zinc finger protein [unclassified Paraburkholderia]
MKTCDGKWVCNFCGSDECEAMTIIIGPKNVAICGACIEICMKAMDARQRHSAAAVASVAAVLAIATARATKELASRAEQRAKSARRHGKS